jgi:mRNA deadenylase subunit
MNVDKLKLIQVGISIADEDGYLPAGVTTWQFNFKFDTKYSI